MEEVAVARSMGWAATVVVPQSSPKVIKFENGDRGVVCPARYGVEGKVDITCNTCTLCKVTDKTANKVVMFPVHGSASTIKKASSKIGDLSK